MSSNVSCDNTITVERGDKTFLNFRCGNYKLTQGDTVIFNVQDIHINKQVQQFEEGGVACIDLEIEDTDKEKGSYDYNIRVITALGVDESVIDGKFIII